MELELLFDRLKNIRQLSEELKIFLETRVKRDTFRKNEIIYRQGENVQKSFFIVSGLVVGETFIEDRSHVCWFLKENDFIEDHDSFLNHVPSSYNAIAAEDTIVLWLNYRDIYNLYHLFPESNFIARHLLTYYHTYDKKRTELLMVLHCRNRYRQFKKDFAWADERLKRAYVASYLNMKPETLSRVEKGDER